MHKSKQKYHDQILLNNNNKKNALLITIDCNKDCVDERLQIYLKKKNHDNSSFFKYSYFSLANYEKRRF